MAAERQASEAELTAGRDNPLVHPVQHHAVPIGIRSITSRDSSDHHTATGGSTHHGKGACCSLSSSDLDGPWVVLHAAVGGQTVESEGVVVTGLQLGPFDGTGHSDRLGLLSVELDGVTVRVGLLTRGGG